MLRLDVSAVDFAVIAFCLDAVVSVAVTLVTEPRPVSELQGRC
jgi:hypothetical protein